ncbi:MAG: IucA/IucC family protein [bacterium]|nr:IucA/IucC family protein [bacterium]
MKIEGVKSLNGFISLERYVNNPKYSETAQYSEVDKIYHPRFGEDCFDMPFYVMDEKDVGVVYANASAGAKNLLYDRAGKIRFFIHPAMKEELVPYFKGFPSGSISVAPSSSTRTLILKGRFCGNMVKTHLNKRISRFFRRLKRDSILHSLAISNELEKIILDPKHPKALGFLPESVGVFTDKDFGGGGFGYIIRESAARPYFEKRYLIPFFALYSSDTKNLEDPPLLLELVRRNKSNVFDFIMNFIIDPLIECWVFIYLNYGLCMESHAQNTLLEVDDNFKPTRIIHRDFQSTPVDPKIAAMKFFTLPFKKHVIGENDYPDFLEQSLIYDHFIGDYLFGALEEFICRFGWCQEEFREAVRKIFKKRMFDQYKYFPEGHVVLSKGLASDNKYELVYKNEPPPYR